MCPALFFSGSFECQPEAVKVKPSFILVHSHITLYHSTFRVRLWEGVVLDYGKEQVKEQILSGELQEDEMLPSLRQLAKDLKISVLTTTRAYNELEEEGFITSRQGKGFFVMSSGSNLIREQLIQEVEKILTVQYWRLNELL